MINLKQEHLDLEEDRLHEECGVFGLFSNREQPLAPLTYLGLLSLQHRGQESAGITYLSNELSPALNTLKGMGLVSEIFKEDDATCPDLNRVGKVKGTIGHVRYSTTGSSLIENAQPFQGMSSMGPIGVAHNGNLVNTEIIRSLLEDGGTSFETSSDTEVILKMLIRGSKKGMDQGIKEMVRAIKGSFAIVVLLQDRLIGIRDPHGIRPLCLGKMEDTYCLASESCALHSVGATFVRDIEPGEIVTIDNEGVHSQKPDHLCKLSTCLFEYIYFARPDSQIDGVSVMQARQRCGSEFYKENPIEADIVIPIPDSGYPAALGFSKASGIPLEFGFIKNRYIGRTFIAPSQEIRERAVGVKLNPVRSVVEGKRIILIDDSIVRGTTSRKLVQLMRDAGAKEVHMGIVSPPIKHPCHFGIDTPATEELIASGRDTHEICQEIGADSLAYISLEGLTHAINQDQTFCQGCLTGNYPLAPHC